MRCGVRSETRVVATANQPARRDGFILTLLRRRFDFVSVRLDAKPSTVIGPTIPRWRRKAPTTPAGNHPICTEEIDWEGRPCAARVPAWENLSAVRTFDDLWASPLPRTGDLMEWILLCALATVSP